jgi:N-acetylglucosaminyldiphosphoundecaprenol N-acetyl-beta-D-mannosaminyltransferase
LAPWADMAIITDPGRSLSHETDEGGREIEVAPHDMNQPWIEGQSPQDDLSREAYSMLGLPIDIVDLKTALNRIEAAARSVSPFLLSTPNVNFLVLSQRDRDFWESLLLSDLCPPDGMFIVWIARLIGIPIKSRAAGSDIFESLKAGSDPYRKLKLFLIGGAEGVAEAASNAINTTPRGISCVGWIDPGYGTAEELSRGEFIDQINASGADVLVAALGAQKGQAWLRQNHDRIRVPIRAHLGAVINFEAGKIRRAPTILQNTGTEWLWRIKEEPYLWKRYFYDGKALVRLLLVRGLPLAIEFQRIRLLRRRNGQDLSIKQSETSVFVMLRVSGDAVAAYVNEATHCFRAAMAIRKPIEIDFSDTRVIDARFLGLLLMLKKCLKTKGLNLKIVGASSSVLRALRLHGLLELYE